MYDAARAAAPPGARRERLPHRPAAAYYPIALDRVCEILSLSTAVLDRIRRIAIHPREQVSHAWPIDAVARTPEGLLLEDVRRFRVLHPPYLSISALTRSQSMLVRNARFMGQPVRRFEEAAALSSMHRPIMPTVTTWNAVRGSARSK
jgi:hypothetical protein